MIGGRSECGAEESSVMSTLHLIRKQKHRSVSCASSSSWQTPSKGEVAVVAHHEGASCAPSCTRIVNSDGWSCTSWVKLHSAADNGEDMFREAVVELLFLVAGMMYRYDVPVSVIRFDSIRIDWLRDRFRTQNLEWTGLTHSA